MREIMDALNHDPAFEAAAREAGFLGFGFYPRFMHRPGRAGSGDVG
jgi:hypothetical protein